jgi:hypothetical protein
LHYFTALHATGVTVSYIVGVAGGLDYAAIVEIRSRRR